MKHFLRRVGFALNGWRLFFASETNGRIQLGIALLVIAAGAYFHLAVLEWVAILVCIAMVLTLEMINSAIERLCNKIEPGLDKDIGWIKDVAAGAVLLAAVLSAVVGAVVFWPYLIAHLAG